MTDPGPKDDPRAVEGYIRGLEAAARLAEIFAKQYRRDGAWGDFEDAANHIAKAIRGLQLTDMP